MFRNIFRNVFQRGLRAILARSLGCVGLGFQGRCADLRLWGGSAHPASSDVPVHGC